MSRRHDNWLNAQAQLRRVAHARKPDRRSRAATRLEKKEIIHWVLGTSFGRQYAVTLCQQRVAYPGWRPLTPGMKWRAFVNCSECLVWLDRWLEEKGEITVPPSPTAHTKLPRAFNYAEWNEFVLNTGGPDDPVVRRLVAKITGSK